MDWRNQKQVEILKQEVQYKKIVLENLIIQLETFENNN